MKKLILISFFSLNICFSFAQGKDSLPSTFTLQQAIDYALKNQVKIQNALYDEQIAANKVKEVTGMGFPQINGSFDLKDYLKVPTSFLPDFISPIVYGVLMDEKLIAPRKIGMDGLFPAQFGTKYNATAGVTASQIIFNSDFFIGLQAAKTFKELSSKNTQRTKIEISVAVTKAYYSVLINAARMNLLNANVARLKQLMEDTKTMFNNGFVEKIDVDRIMVTYNNLLTEKQKVERFLGLSYILLKYQMGMDQAADLVLTDKIENIQFQSNDITANEKFDYSKRVEFSLLETQNRLAKLDLKKNKLGYLPNMVLYGTASTQAQRQEFNIFSTSEKWYPVGIIGTTINIPIFDGLQKNYRIQQSKINLLKNENDMKFLKQSIDVELTSSKITLQNSVAALDVQKKNIELAEEVFNAAKLKYQQGVGSNIEVLTAETSLKEAQTNYYNALYDALIAKVDYEKASGTLK